MRIRQHLNPNGPFKRCYPEAKVIGGQSKGGMISSMKGSSSSAYAQRIIAAILMLLIFWGGALANDLVIYEKASDAVSSDESSLGECDSLVNGDHIWESDTDDEGRWEICNLPPGTYNVCEVNQTGWNQTYPVDENTSDPICHVVYVRNSNVSNINFLNRGDYCLSGHKYWDKNRNGQRDPGEVGLSGWTITATDDESNTWETTTDSNGFWEICNLPSASYDLFESAPEGEIGWIATQIPGRVTIMDLSIEGLDFGNWHILYDEPKQYEQFCESQLVEGTGYVQVETSVMDKKLALDYKNQMFGEGDIGMESSQVYSQQPNKLIRPVPNCSDPNGSTPQKLNFFENMKLVYNGSMPLTGSRSISSNDFYGGIGANVQETFSVKRMEADQMMFLGQTSNSTVRYSVGLNTLNSFNGTWATESNLHKMFYEDIKKKDLFSGEFNLQKELKLHKNPLPMEGFISK